MVALNTTDNFEKVIESFVSIQFQENSGALYPGYINKEDLLKSEIDALEMEISLTYNKQKARSFNQLNSTSLMQ